MKISSYQKLDCQTTCKPSTENTDH